MARSAADLENRRLAELKGVDGAYPLYGETTLTSGEPLQEALAARDGVWGAVAERGLLNLLDIDVGDQIVVGELTYEVRGILDREPA